MNSFFLQPGSREWAEDMNLHSERDVHSKSQFFRNTLLVSSSMYAILISLHATPVQDQCIRLVFVVAIVLLAACILFQLAALYDLSTLDERRKNRLAKEEFQHVSRGEGYDPSRVFVGNRKVSLFLQRCSIFLFVLSILSLSYYTILIFV